MKAYARPRPLRVAYLVSECKNWQEMLEAVFAESFSRWGGRFTLIVPCENGSVIPSYLPWLEKYDPDLIYSYVDLDDTSVEAIHDRFGPAYLLTHEFFGEKERNRHTFRPRLPVDPLTVFSVIGLMGRPGPMTAQERITLVDTHIGARPSSFLQQNFGCYGESLNPWPMGADMGDFLKTLTFVPPEIQENKQLVPRAQGDLVSSEAELLKAVAGQKNVLGLAQMSASFTPRLEIEHGAWSRTVNVVVGDSFFDRLIFWNALSLTPVWLGGNLATLNVSESDLNDPDRFNSIVNIIQKRIYFPLGGNVSFAQVVLRSASVNASELEKWASKFQAAEKWNRYTFEAVSSPEAFVPSEEALQRARQNVESGSVLQSPDWHELKIHEEVFRPPAVLPRHLRDTPLVPGRAKSGFWQIDLDIQRAVDHSSFQNKQHHWRLPRRLPMEAAFTSAYQLSRMAPFCRPRTTAEGLLSISAAAVGQLPEITLPNDESAFRFALCARRDWISFGRDHQKLKPGPALAIRPSDKGRYVTALLRMSGDIHRAKEIFLSEFWKGQFELLGATPKATDERIAAVSERIRKRLKNHSPSSNEGREALAKLILFEARAERFPETCLKFDQLRKGFDSFRSAFWNANPENAPDGEEIEDEAQTLAASTKYLCERGVPLWRLAHPRFEGLFCHLKNSFNPGAGIMGEVLFFPLRVSIPAHGELRIS